MLAALDLLGVKEIYKVGGAQAVGALAYGTKSIPAVDKILRPGNAFVNEAKRQVYGIVGIDLLPGPSEIMVIADSSSNLSENFSGEDRRLEAGENVTQSGSTSH